jgi:hypothetical protein
LITPEHAYDSLSSLYSTVTFWELYRMPTDLKQLMERWQVLVFFTFGGLWFKIVASEHHRSIGYIRTGLDKKIELSFIATRERFRLAVNAIILED